MGSVSKVTLTKSAEERLAKAVETYRSEIVASIERENFVPGEDVSEATASDIDAAVLRIRRGKTRRVQSRKLMAQFAVVFGAILALSGFFLPDFERLTSNPVRLALIVAGMYAVVGGLYLYGMISMRYSEANDYRVGQEEKIAQLEQAVKELSNSIRYR